MSKAASVPDPLPTESRQFAHWNPEDAAFWETTGKAIARRNLWISVPCLLCAFSVWGYWSIITVQMKNLGFPFTAAQLFTLTGKPRFFICTVMMKNLGFPFTAAQLFTLKGKPR